MNALKLIPVFLALVFIAAHHLRAGETAFVVAWLAAPVLLFVRRPWVPRLFQVALCGAFLVWVATLADIAQSRMAGGEPWGRMAIILATVAIATAASALVFETRSLRVRYRRSQRG